MRKTNTIETDIKLTADINALQNMLSVGKNTAAKIGAAAGAEFHVGKRKLYNVHKVQEYLDSLTEV